MFRIQIAFVVVAVTTAAFAMSPAAQTQNVASTEVSPVGTYLWFPASAGPSSDDDCRALVERVKPSREKADQWRWGRMPDSTPGSDNLYLVMTETRMEPTFSAEGDYDSGDIRLGPTNGGETPFILIPDEHPDMTIKGIIIAKPGSQIVRVTLHDIPIDEGQADRIVSYCRFDEPSAEI